MGKKDKQNAAESTPEKNTAQQPTADEAAKTAETAKADETAEKSAEPETFTVTREQMEKMEGLAKSLADEQDKYLRLAAEYDNYRKRTAKEKENLYADAKIDTIKALVDTNHVVIACGGGGIPVFATEGHHLKGAAAVIDKDFAAERMAEQLDADDLVILTAVEKVAVNFGKPNQEWLSALTPEKAREYMAEGQFAPGSMLPKVEAAVKFAESGAGRRSLITLLEKARDGIAGRTGTIVEA